MAFLFFFMKENTLPSERPAGHTHNAPDPCDLQLVFALSSLQFLVNQPLL